MKTRMIVTIVLLVFVAASAAYLVYDSIRGSAPVPDPGGAPENPVSQAEKPGAVPEAPVGGAEKPGTAAEDQSGTPETAGAGRKVIAYYFYTTRRCPTCIKFEAYTSETLRKVFAPQLESGKLEFKLVNVDETGNRHFINDYQLTTKSVVLADFVDGEQARWKNLDMIWDYVGEKQTFMSYIETETREMLGELCYE